MRISFAPLAAIALFGLTACSGNSATDNAAAENAVIETNLTTLDEPLANDTTFGNDSAFGNDVALSGDNALLDAPATNAVDPVANAF
ncbi:hypothetical protein QLH51_14580 [Sphingomonas sp. 2R-10]|uniref:hypothetical protein n=1 Tax=Sphingomonas sp. 2R-10 TaxID=3045148 RepID=UPI000F79E8B6|nr:hypothetical protein [Sphingomonas sp. 2R-10]MDJ0278022.1 hypothetical protein [Sphingomonas sp. 2R-10]